MTLDELDRLAAEKIMEWFGIYLEDNVWLLPRTPVGCIFKEREDWQPTRNISQAWELLEKFPEWKLDYEHGNFQAIIFSNGDMHYGNGDAPLAIVKAVLKTRGISIDEK